MTRRFLWTLILVPTWAVAGDPPAVDHVALARRAWAITDVVAAHGIDPPPRGDLLAAGMTALLHPTDGRLPADVRARLATVADADGLAAVLRSVWPADAAADAFLQGLLPRRPGEPEDGDRLHTAADLKIREQIAQNRYVGTGIQTRFRSELGYSQIIMSFVGGPARRAGARAGDLIVAVDGVDMKGKPMMTVVQALRGEAGTDVTMTVRQPDGEATRDLKMTRAVVPFETTLGYRRNGEAGWQYRPDPALPIAYLRLGTVNVSTLHDLRRVEKRLTADGCRALILDLRRCIAAELDHVALVADGLIDSGVLWRVRDAKGRVTERTADRDALFRDWPIVALIDDTTAGTGVFALAAALQDRGRAICVGQPTPPAGAVRSLLPLPDGGAVTLTTAVLERSKGAGEAARRVLPDHVVETPSSRQLAVEAWQRAQENPDADPNASPPDDALLARALELLKVARP
ncbi:MAG: S41 family peptidase [Gemmataceae bacterium]